VLVDDQQVKWLSDSFQQGQRDVMEVPGPIECDPDIIVRQRVFEPPLEPVEGPEATGESKSRTPLPRRYPIDIPVHKQIRLQ
jgi:hypothetical protein